MKIALLAAIAALFAGPADDASAHKAKWQCSQKVVRHFTASCDKGGNRLNNVRLGNPFNASRAGIVRNHPGMGEGGCKGKGGGNCGVGKGNGGGNGTGNEGKGKGPKKK